MDNVTHTLIGVAIGRAAGSRAAVIAAVAASNLPDLDFVAPLFLGSGNLTYVLHHRGWTHTFLFAPVIIALAVAIARDRKPAVMVAASLGWLLHVGFDLLNSYGAHPLSPFDDRWRYGDTLFVVEPLLWLTLLPHAFQGTSRRLRIAAGIVGSVAFLGAAFGPLTSLLMLPLVVLWSFAAFLLRRNAIAIAGACALVIAVFAVAAIETRSAVVSTLPADERALDVILRPGLSNPFCFGIVARSETAHAEIVSRLGIAGPCEPGDEKGSANIASPSIASTDRVRWLGEWRTTRQEMATLAVESCRFAALLRFARAPYFTDRIAGDLRYDFSPALDFADIELAGPCPRAVPDWVPPAR